MVQLRKPQKGWTDLAVRIFGGEKAMRGDIVRKIRLLRNHYIEKVSIPKSRLNETLDGIMHLRFVLPKYSQFAKNHSKLTYQVVMAVSRLQKSDLSDLFDKDRVERFLEKSCNRELMVELTGLEYPPPILFAAEAAKILKDSPLRRFPR